MSDCRAELETLINLKLKIIRELDDLMFYMDYAISHDDVTRLENSIEARQVQIKEYDEVELRYREVLNRILLDFDGCEEKLLQIYQLSEQANEIKMRFLDIWEKEQVLSERVAQMFQDSKEELKKINHSKRATNGYFRMEGSQGRIFDNKK